MSLSAANDSQVKIVCRNGDKRAHNLVMLNKKSTLGLTHCVEYGTNLLT
ncbi:hypothetical protein VCHE09_2813 [Vibrio paracholerae HE-09]|nr:hypothetical protein VCHE09_2813 [Vibrio paracholerae HE-09]